MYRCRRRDLTRSTCANPSNNVLGSMPEPSIISVRFIAAALTSFDMLRSNVGQHLRPRCFLSLNILGNAKLMLKLLQFYSLTYSTKHSPKGGGCYGGGACTSLHQVFWFCAEEDHLPSHQC